MEEESLKGKRAQQKAERKGVRKSSPERKQR